MNLGNLVLFIVTASAFYVYYDATSNKIGKVKKLKKSFTNSSAGEWATSVLLLWIIVFPVYLMKRQKLIKRAKKYPRRPKAVGLKLTVLGSLVVFTFLLGIANNRGTQRQVTNRTQQGSISVEDFLVDWSKYKNKSVTLHAYVITENANSAFIYNTNMGNGFPSSMSRLSKADKKMMLKNCGGQPCEAFLKVKSTPVMGSKGAEILEVIR